MSFHHSRRDRSRFNSAPAHAAVFIDYENLFSFLSGRLPAREHPQAYITELVDALRQRLREEYRAPAVLLNAYADFTALQGDAGVLQRMLIEQEIVPRPTSAGLGADAAAFTLAIEAVEAAARPDVRLVVAVTGDRAYLPLVQHLKRLGRETLVVALDNPVTADAPPYFAADLFLDTHTLFGEKTRRQLFGGNGKARKTAAGAPHREQRLITDDATLQTLEVIEEHFGQYDEVYLTPLLRKLSETFEEEDPTYDPKIVVAELEEAGAVWLEKRRGFPYDYTVLLVNDDHPDVQRVQEAYDADMTSYDDEERDLAYEDDYADEDDWAESTH